MTNRKYRILAVDDQTTNLEILKGVLELDYEVDVADNGAEALQLALQNRPDVMLLDIMMPEMDGFEVCRQMRAHPALRNCKILMLTAKSAPTDRLQGFDAGADDYLTKPFDISELLAKVRVFLRLKTVEEVDQMKTDLLSLLNHETRTPLNGIIAPAEMLLENDDVSPDERRMWTEMIYTNSRNLLSFIQKATALNALSGAERPLNLHMESIGDIVRQQIAQSELGNQIVAHFDDVICAELDYEEFGRAIGYLISFALKNTEPGHQVVARLLQGPDGAHLTMTFDGQICEQQESLFARSATSDDLYHYRDQSRLEMAIAQRILELHRCDVQLHDHRGRSRISIAIPLTHHTDLVDSLVAEPIAAK